MVIVEMCRPRPGPGPRASTSSAAEARGKRRLPVNYLASCTQLRPSWTWTQPLTGTPREPGEVGRRGYLPLRDRAAPGTGRPERVARPPARTAQRRIVVRHFYLSCRGETAIVVFVLLPPRPGMRGYYNKPALEPTSATDWDALSRALTQRRLEPYLGKVAHLRHPRDVRRFRREFT